MWRHGGVAGDTQQRAREKELVKQLSVDFTVWPDNLHLFIYLSNRSDPTMMCAEKSSSCTTTQLGGRETYPTDKSLRHIDQRNLTNQVSSCRDVLLRSF